MLKRNKRKDRTSKSGPFPLLSSMMIAKLDESHDAWL